MNRNINYILENILNDIDALSDITDPYAIDSQYLYKYFPKTKEELKNIIAEHFKNGITDLNDIDVSNITDFSKLFDSYDPTVSVDIIFDVSKWNVSNGTNFRFMFRG